MKKILMFDLETLGTNPKAPVVQIGAVVGDEEGNIFEMFKRNIEFTDLENYDFKIDYSTIKWWLEQSNEARESITSKDNRSTLREAVLDFKEFILSHKQGGLTIWSHATFDPPILMNLFNQIGVKNPVAYWKYLDVRTLEHMVPIGRPEREGVHHDALDDSIYQYKYVIQMLNERSLQDSQPTKRLFTDGDQESV